MIAGLGGDLVSQAYVEHHLLTDANRTGLGPFQRGLARWWRQVSRSLGPASSARAIHDVAAVPLLRLLHHEPPSTAPDIAGLSASMPGAAAVLLSVPWTAAPASMWRDAIRLGLDAQASWALICNGRSLRIVDCTRTWSRSAVEFDFDRLMASAAGVDALWLLANAASLGTAGDRSLRGHVSASDAETLHVCRSLSDGVLAILPRLARALETRSRRSGSTPTLDQALTLVYRVLFLLFAEARGLVPTWNAIYRQSYTIASLTTRARSPVPDGLWESLQAISRLAHSGCRAGDLVVTAFNGRLFSPRHAPLTEQRRVPDIVIRDVLLSLATAVTPRGRRMISFHDLGVEQLGSVYERVLEYEPARGSAALARTSTRRKSTGSFYTPRSLTEFLVRRTLAPLVEGKSAEQILSLRILDPSMGSGAFLVAACRYLADSCEHAMMRDGTLSTDDAATTSIRLRRTIAERCLYGVDLNPTAVQLARVSLWLTTLAGDRPLTFLDHHLATGNSLIGAWLGDLSRRPRRTSANPTLLLPLFDSLIADDVAMRILPERLRMALEPSESVDIVRNKERALAHLTRDDGVLAKWKRAADAWCAASLWPGAPPSDGLITEWIAAATGGPTTIPEPRLKESLDRARAVSAAHDAFHWELAFPEIFFDANGRRSENAGFDAVIGNPPWEMLRADTGSSSDRRQSRPATSAALTFFRASRTYSLQGSGHPNCYQLFLERSLQLTRPGGRIGLLLPSGIATDHGSATLRRQLFDRTMIDSWIGFDNRRRIFPIHRSVRFVLLTTTNGGATAALRFRCGVTDPAALHAPDADTRTLTLSRSRIAAMSPELLTVPEVPNGAALRILIGISDRVPALAAPSGWNARFGRELNATDDRGHFVRLTNRSRTTLPIVEGKQVSPFQVDVSRSQVSIPIKAATTLLDAGTFRRDRICYRDVANATNKLTLIAAMLPAGVISTHTVFCLKTSMSEDEQWCLLGLMNSLVANYLVRLQVTTHVTTSLMSRLPIPKPTESVIKQMAELSRRLAASGIDAGVDDYAELNAIAASLYGISEDEYLAILESFPLLPRTLIESCSLRGLNAKDAKMRRFFR